MLFVEFHGTDASVAEQSKRFGEIAAEFRGGPFDWATRQEERSRDTRPEAARPARGGYERDGRGNRHNPQHGRR